MSRQILFAREGCTVPVGAQRRLNKIDDVWGWLYGSVMAVYTVGYKRQLRNIGKTLKDKRNGWVVAQDCCLVTCFNVV